MDLMPGEGRKFPFHPFFLSEESGLRRSIYSDLACNQFPNFTRKDITILQPAALSMPCSDMDALGGFQTAAEYLSPSRYAGVRLRIRPWEPQFMTAWREDPLLIPQHGGGLRLWGLYTPLQYQHACVGMCDFGITAARSITDTAAECPPFLDARRHGRAPARPRIFDEAS